MSVLDQVDHLVYATADLESTVADLERRLGVRASPGGRHPGRGTRNALLAIGARSYLEIVGPDPEQDRPSTPRWFGIDSLGHPRLVTWAARSTDLRQVVRNAARGGLKLGPITAGSRQRPDGIQLHWQFTEPGSLQEDGILPFFIDWQSSPHPAAMAATGVTLTAFFAEHPDPQRILRQLRILGLELEVRHARAPALVGILRTSTGMFAI
jgi:Glyoxalase-like domain